MTLVGVEAGSERVVDLSPDLRLAYLGDTKIYEHRSVLPRAFVVGRTRVAQSEESALKMLNSPALDLRREAVVPDADWRRPGGGLSSPDAATSAASVMVVEYRPERVIVEADLAAPGLLVLTDSDYPGWTALVDGEERPIQRADYAFRGVLLEAGRHRVELVYQPGSFRAGLIVSGLAGVAVVGLVALRGRRRRAGDGATLSRRRSPEHDLAGSRRGLHTPGGYGIISRAVDSLEVR